jgi:hypothetical protein
MENLELFFFAFRSTHSTALSRFSLSEPAIEFSCGADKLIKKASVKKRGPHEDNRRSGRTVEFRPLRCVLG